MRARKLIEGAEFVIYGLVDDAGRCDADDYIDGLQPVDRKKLVALLSRTGEAGPPTIPEKWGFLEDALYEFKSYQDRLVCFFHGSRDGKRVIVITHGLKKKKNRLDRREIERAQGRRAEFLEGGGRYE